jgi:hypothetical protein
MYHTNHQSIDGEILGKMRLICNTILSKWAVQMDGGNPIEWDQVSPSKHMNIQAPEMQHDTLKFAEPLILVFVHPVVGRISAL